MNVQETIFKRANISFTESEAQILDSYLKNNALKFSPWLKILVLRELESHSLIQELTVSLSSCINNSRRKNE